MSQGPISRREFSRYLSALAMGAGAATPFALQLAAMNSAAAQTASSYKALVCIFLFGGNDANNMVLATDNDSWGRYYSARNSGDDPIAVMPVGTAPVAVGATSPVTGRTVTRATPEFMGGVVPITPATAQTVPAGTNATSRSFALHPMLSPVVPLFSAGRLAVLANVGTLIQPTTRAQFAASSAPLPAKLFSHNDQQSEWQAGAAEGALYGWGGMLADLLLSSNANSVYTAISTAGNAVFLSGRSVVQYQVSTGNPPALLVMNAGTGNSLMGSSVAAARFSDIIRDTSSTSYFASDQAAVVKRSMDAATLLNSSFTGAAVTAVPAPPAFTNPVTNTVQSNPLALQLQTVARIIAANAALGAGRQVFFVNLGGFDTHQNQNSAQPVLMAQLAQGLTYFDNALSNVGGVDMRSKVTAFTASEFSRTFTTNGSGTDHAWGSHHLIWGGALNAGTIYGQYPTLGVDAGAFQNPDIYASVMIPTASVDQYAATLGSWFGASSSQLAAIFPNLANFPVKNLGFV